MTIKYMQSIIIKIIIYPPCLSTTQIDTQTDTHTRDTGMGLSAINLILEIRMICRLNQIYQENQKNEDCKFYLI